MGRLASTAEPMAEFTLLTVAMGIVAACSGAVAPPTDPPPVESTPPAAEPAPASLPTPPPPLAVPTRAHPDTQPDLALIVIDTLRASRLTVLGHDEPLMPTVSDLASQAAFFPRALASSTYTAPSTASILTGRYPAHHGVIIGLRTRPMGDDRELPHIPLQVPTVAERLAAAGWQTAGVAANFNVGPELGLSAGLGSFERVRPRGDAEHMLGSLARTQAPDERPRFTYLHYNDPHEPLDCRSPRCTPPDDAVLHRYDSELAYLDGHLHEAILHLRSEAERRGRDLALVLSSDHGELFGEHGIHGHPEVIWHELQEVLLVIQVPGMPAARVSTRVSQVDITPTLLELAGLEVEGLDGRSLLPLLRDETELPDARPLFAHRIDARSGSIEHIRAVTQGDRKLIRDPMGDRLYAADLPEGADLAQAEPQRLAELQRVLDAHVATARRDTPRVIELSEEVEEQLRLMGYVEE